MRISKDKKYIRYQMVLYALSHGNKSAARQFNTSPNVIRKWRKLFLLKGYLALEDKSRRPLHSPNQTPKHIIDFAISLKNKYHRLGAEQIKSLEYIPISAKTMRKIWRQAGLSSRKRKKKYIVKNNLRAIKQAFNLFEKACEDTKDLKDIPQYWPQMKKLNLPQWQYTYREVSCGIQFLGFANQRSSTHATLFAHYLNYYFKKFNALPQLAYRQTDNGSEFIGSVQAKKSSPYTKAVESLPGQFHSTIFPGAHRMQADVETVHNLIEMEFYEIELFNDRQDFLRKAYTYQLFFNLQRPNTYKENKSPWQLAQLKRKNLNKKLLMIPPVDLDDLFTSFTKGGNYLLTDPYPKIYCQGNIYMV